MAIAAFDNTARFDIGSWANNWTSVNVTQYVPSARDLALAGPRMFMKLGSFFAVPEAVDNIFGQRIIPEATRAGVVNAMTTAAAAREVAHAAEILVDVDQQASGIASRFSLESARSLGSVVSYSTSKWALLCVVMAVVLNRTHIYASTRRNLTLPWKVRFFIRFVPIVLLLVRKPPRSRSSCSLSLIGKPRTKWFTISHEFGTLCHFRRDALHELQFAQTK